jgi:hypothetical protein
LCGGFDYRREQHRSLLLVKQPIRNRLLRQVAQREHVFEDLFKRYAARKGARDGRVVGRHFHEQQHVAIRRLAAVGDEAGTALEARRRSLGRSRRRGRSGPAKLEREVLEQTNQILWGFYSLLSCDALGDKGGSPTASLRSVLGEERGGSLGGGEDTELLRA